MCNPHTVRKSAKDLVAHFGTEVRKPIDMKPDRAGFCRKTGLWGPCYAGMTSDSNDAVKLYNPPIQALLRADE